jgi:predicted DNA-binding transcriptional regulator AlpA
MFAGERLRSRRTIMAFLRSGPEKKSQAFTGFTSPPSRGGKPRAVCLHPRKILVPNSGAFRLSLRRSPMSDHELLNAFRRVVREELHANGHFKNKFLSLKETAAVLNVSQSSIRRWSKIGRIPKPFTKPWGTPRWLLEEILKCIKRD